MLSILVLVFVCRKNYQNARARARSGGGAVAYTIALWYGFAAFGFFLGLALVFNDLEPYVMGYDFSYSPDLSGEESLRIVLLTFGLGWLCQGLGGVASYLVARHGEIVNRIPASPYGAASYYTTAYSYGAPAYPAPPPQGYNQPYYPPYGLPQPQPASYSPAYGQPTVAPYTQPTGADYGAPAANPYTQPVPPAAPQTSAPVYPPAPKTDWGIPFDGQGPPSSHP